MLHITCRKSR